MNSSIFNFSYPFREIKLHSFFICIGNVNEVPNFFIHDKTPNTSLVEEFKLSSFGDGECRNNSLCITKFRDSGCIRAESGIYNTGDLGTIGSLTLALERKLKTDTDLSKTSSSPSSSSSRQGFKRQLIRQSTVEGIKDYFKTIEKLERNSMSFVAKTRRASLPLPSTTQNQNSNGTQMNPSKTVSILLR